MSDLKDKLTDELINLLNETAEALTFLGVSDPYGLARLAVVLT